MLVYPLVIALFLLARTTEFQMRVGIFLTFLGMGVRLWANGYAGHLKVNKTEGSGQPKIGHLITAGPYGYVRNPLYFGSLLIGLGFCTIVGSWWLAFIAGGCLFWVYRSKISEEEEVLRHEWTHEYERYQSMVPRWLPTWKRYPNGYGEWSWKGVVASKELKTVVWVVILLIALYLREEIFQEHNFLSGKNYPLRIFLIGLLLFLLVFELIMEVRKHRLNLKKG